MEIRHERINPGVYKAELDSKAVTVKSWRIMVSYSIIPIL